MSDLTLSVLGMYNQDPTILNSTNFPLPEGVDRDVLLPLILSETAELEVLYPEPTTFKTIVKAWAAARKPSWERMFLALDEEYNPLHNYDRHEEESSSDDETAGYTNSSTVTNQVTGFNSNTFADNDKSVGSGSLSGTRGLEHERDLHVYGNIGVTTSAQMLAGELDIRKQDIYRIIANEFTEYFCIMVY